jgi:hypothetical protein
MRWIKKKPKDQTVVKKFFWWPKTIFNQVLGKQETRWLEFSSYKRHWQPALYPTLNHWGHWVEDYWL